MSLSAQKQRNANGIKKWHQIKFGAIILLAMVAIVSTLLFIPSKDSWQSRRVCVKPIKNVAYLF